MSLSTLAGDFPSYFTEKIEAIKIKLPTVHECNPIRNEKFLILEIFQLILETPKKLIDLNKNHHVANILTRKMTGHYVPPNRSTQYHL